MGIVYGRVHKGFQSESENIDGLLLKVAKEPFHGVNVFRRFIFQQRIRVNVTCPVRWVPLDAGPLALDFPTVVDAAFGRTRRAMKVRAGNGR